MDYESLAAQGRQFSQAILTVEPRQAKSWKGPVTRQRGTFVRRRYPFHQNSEHSAPWVDQRALTVLVGESALREMSAETRRLLQLSAVDGYEVTAAQALEAPQRGLWVLSTSITPDPSDDQQRSGMYRAELKSVADGGERSRIIYAEKGLIEWMVRRSEGALGQAKARALAWELQAIEKMDFDLLVVSPTTEDHLAQIGHRSGDDGGVVDPRQALTIVEIYLRNRGQYIRHIDQGRRTHTDTTTFYVDLANAQMPVVLTALRSCLSPDRRHGDPALWRQLEAVLARQHDLCIATQNLRRLHLEEGYLGGSLALLSQQLYHLHAVLTLAVGTQDILAGLVADVTGADVKGVPRSWAKMLKGEGRGWKNGGQRTQKAINSAAQHQLTPFLALLQALRNVYQHDGMVNAALAEIHELNPSGRSQLVRARFSIVMVDQTLKGRSDELDNLVKAWGDESVGPQHGIHRLDGPRTFIAIPHRLAETATWATAKIANDLLRDLDGWPDPDWITDDPSARDMAAHLWGPMHLD